MKKVERMMKRKSEFVEFRSRGKVTAMSAVLLLTALFSSPPAVSRDWIEVRPNPNPIKVAVEDFRSVGQGGEPAARHLTDKMREVISFTGLFSLIDPAHYPMVVTAPGREVSLDPWSQIGASLLIRATVTRLDSDSYQLEVRCFDVAQGQMVLGKRYTGGKELFNRMILRYVDELIGWLQPWEKGALDARIAYVTNRSGRNEIHVMDTDGSHDRAITRNRTLNLSPSWSPKGRHIIYTGYQARNPDLYLADLDQGREWKLFGQRGLNIAGEFSPDGSMVAFSREGADGNIDIYLIGVDGKNLQRVTTSPAIEVSPTWSPDGRFLAFVSNREGGPQIYLLDLSKGAEGTGNRPVRLTHEGSYNTDPAWSPDGRYIVYSGRVGGQFDLFLINMAGEGNPVKRLTATRADEENPAWSPDSRFLVYNSNKYGKYDIFIVSIYGGEPKRITSSPGHDRMPAWSPRIE